MMVLSNEVGSGVIFRSSYFKAIIVLLEFAMKNNMCLKKNEEKYFL